MPINKKIPKALAVVNADNCTGCEVAVDLDKCPTFADPARNGLDGERCIEPPDLNTHRRRIERSRIGRIAMHPQPGGDVCTVCVGTGDDDWC